MKKIDLLFKKVFHDNFLSAVMYKSIIANFAFTALCAIFGLVLTKTYYFYLGDSVYGVWATITSIASWINYADLGIGNGVRNGLAEASSKNDIVKRNKTVVTSLYTLSKMAIILFVIITALTELLIVANVLEYTYRIPMYVTNFFFCLDLFLGIGKAFAAGMQKSWIESFENTCVVVLRVIVIGLLILFNCKVNLTFFAIIVGVCGSVVNGVFLCNIVKNFKIGNNRKNCHDNSLRKDIMSLSFQFFILQLTCLVLYASDNVIIYKLFDSEMVTKYDFINKVYTTCGSAFNVFLAALWPAVAYAYSKNHISWIKKEIKRLLGVLAIYSAGIICVSFLFNFIVEIWLGVDAPHYDSSLIALFAVYAILTAFGSIFVYVTNGLGRLKLQMYFSVILAICNVPLSVFLARSCSMGIFGVKLATLVCCVGTIIFVPIDVIKFLSQEGKQTISSE